MLTLVRAAQLLQSEIKQCKNITRNEISESASSDIIPDTLYMFLKFILDTTSGEDQITLDRSNATDESVHRHILSVAQDFIFMLSKGAEQPPKQIGLAMTVRHMTGSKEIARMLNHYGHCISYDELEWLDTAIANEIIQKHETDGIVLPNNIQPGRFIHFAADNNDLNVETLDGKSTTHATTLVMYQEQDVGQGNFGHCFLQQSCDKRKER